MSDSSKDSSRVAQFDLIESLIEKSSFKEALARIRKEEADMGPDRFSCEWGWLCHLAAQALQGLGIYDQALSKAGEALRIFRATLENEKLAQIQFNLGIIHADLGSFKKAELQFWDAASTCRRIEDKKGVAKAYNELSRLYFTRGRYDLAIEYLNESVEYCDKIKDQKLISTIFGNLGTVCMISDRWKEARDNLLKSLRLNKDRKNDIDVCCSRLSLAYLSILLRRLAEADEHLQMAHRIISKNGYAREKAIYHEYSGELAFVRGDLKTASRHYSEAISLGEQIAPRSAIISQSYRLLAELQIAKGDWEDALVSCEKSLLASRDVGERLEEAAVHRILGWIYTQDGHPHEVKKNFHRATRMLEEMGVRFELAKTYLFMGQCDSYTFWERMRLLGRAEDLASHLDTPYYLAKVHTGFAELLLQEKKLAEAGEFLSKAKGVFKKLDEKQELELLSGLEKRIETISPSGDQASVAGPVGSFFGEIVTQDQAFLGILESARQVKDVDMSILLEGETGTGKDLLAKAIHSGSNRKDGEFVVVSCAALPEGLFESELFGYKKGAFTGAVADKKGFVDEANGGTLYLDEIADVPLSVQVKLLRAIEEKEVVRVGDVKPRKVDFRVIAATNRDLDELVSEGGFRSDLFYRLSGIRLRLPPLKDRKDDIPLLVEHFLKKYCVNGVSRACICDTRRPSSVPSVDPEVMELLRNHEWPGNIRELENFVKQMFIACKGEQIITQSTLAGMTERFNAEKYEEDTLPDKVMRLQKDEIEKALAQANGVKSQAARILGIDEALLRYKMKTLGISYPAKPNQRGQ